MQFNHVPHTNIILVYNELNQLYNDDSRNE